MDYKEFRAKNVDDAITNACIELGVPTEELDYEVIEKGGSGFLGIGAREALIKARKKDENSAKETVVEAEEKEMLSTVEASVDTVLESIEEESKEDTAEEASEDVSSKRKEKSHLSADQIEKIAKDFLTDVLGAMDIESTVNVTIEEGEKENNVDIDIVGDNMGILIGKRGQTLDSLQYLVSLVVNKDSDTYNRVRIDTENYRERRKQTLENLAKNMAIKAKRTRRPVSLEPMNPYERRIIHSALQNDKYCTTKSEGEDPYRHVVIVLKK